MEAGATLISPLGRVKEHHLLRCNACGTEFSATPLSITQIFKKWGTNGCAVCNTSRQQLYKHGVRQANIQKILDRGLEIVTDWDGTTGTGRESIPINVTVRNTKCGHTFTSTAKNLLTRGVECPICAKTYKTNIINHWSELNSARWRQTATEWKIYKSTVTKLSRVSYQQNKHHINPNNLPTGKAGTEGAYHIDHIVPIRYCYNNGIPPDICAHYTNLQMLGWRENIGSRDKLKDTIPAIFEGHII
jgi:hypothetical protein